MLFSEEKLDATAMSDEEEAKKGGEDVEVEEVEEEEEEEDDEDEEGNVIRMKRLKGMLDMADIDEKLKAVGRGMHKKFK